MLKEAWLWHAKQEPHYLNLPLFNEMNYEQYLRLQTLKNPEARAWVVEEEGRAVIGYGRVEVQTTDRYRAFRRFILIDDIVVRKEYDTATSGVRELLLDAIRVFAKEQGISHLFTRVYAFNKAEQAWFEQQGFELMHMEYLKELS